jgi:hypothetical protein
MKQQWELTTPFGMFHLKLDNDVLTLGGEDTCVMIVYKGQNDSLLDQLGTDRSCELRGFHIKGETTKNMLYTATSIFRSLYQDVRYLNLLDASTYKCKFDDGSLRSISLRESHFLFHGKTYYEDKFQAEPVYEEDKETMAQFRNALHDPSKKPEYFNFKDTRLTSELTSLYNASSTWWEFFQAIQLKWKDTKCTKIYVWHRNALYEMMKGKTIPQYWKLDLKKFPFIHPKFKKIYQTGGKHRTRKNRKEKQYYSYYDELDFVGLFPMDS